MALTQIKPFTVEHVSPNQSIADGPRALGSRLVSFESWRIALSSGKSQHAILDNRSRSMAFSFVSFPCSVHFHTQIISMTGLVT